MMPDLVDDNMIIHHNWIGREATRAIAKANVNALEDEKDEIIGITNACAATPGNADIGAMTYLMRSLTFAQSNQVWVSYYIMNDSCCSLSSLFCFCFFIGW
jgi:hypothetical protein